MKTIIHLSSFGLIILFLAGCAGSRKKSAFDEFTALERNVYVSSKEVNAGSDLPAINDTSSLQTYLAYAALSNPGLEAAFNRWKAALERVPQVRSLPDPRFTYGYFIREVETRVGPQQHRFGIVQMFPWFGTLQLKGNAALEAANMAKAQYQAAKLKLFYQVKDAYYEYSYLGRAIRVMEENVQLMTYLESVVMAKYRAGTAPHSSLVKAQVELDKLNDQLKSLVDILTPLKARLNAAMNRPLQADLALPGRIPLDTLKTSPEQFAEWLKESNPDLKADEYLAAKEKFSIDLAKKSYYPDITLGVDYITTGEARMPGMVDSGKDPLIAMFSINLPLWWGRNKAAVNEAAARQQSADRQRQNKENELLSRLEMVLYQFREAGRKIQLYRDALLPRSLQALNVAQSAFEAGKIDFLDLIDAQRTYLEFQLSLERNYANYAQRLAELEMLTGRDINQQ